MPEWDGEMIYHYRDRDIRRKCHIPLLSEKAISMSGEGSGEWWGDFEGFRGISEPTRSDWGWLRLTGLTVPASPSCPASVQFRALISWRLQISGRVTRPSQFHHAIAFTLPVEHKTKPIWYRGDEAVQINAVSCLYYGIHFVEKNLLVHGG